MNAIDSAMSTSRTKADFIANIEQMGYSVKWIDRYKYITYTTPEGQKCRDNRLHEEKYLKERMEQFYEHRQIQGIEQAGQSAYATGKPVRGIQPENSVLRNPAGSIEYTGSYDNGSRKAPSTHAGKNRGTADMEGLDGQYSTDSRTGDERTHTSRQSVRKQLKKSVQQSDGNDNDKCGEVVEQQDFQAGTNAPSTGQHTDQASVEVDMHRGIDTDSIIEAVVALENLLAVRDQPKKEEQKQVVERKNRQKKKQSHDHDWEMSL